MLECENVLLGNTTTGQNDRTMVAEMFILVPTLGRQKIIQVGTKQWWFNAERTMLDQRFGVMQRWGIATIMYLNGAMETNTYCVVWKTTLLT